MAARRVASDVNQIAFRVVSEATKDVPAKKKAKKKRKDPAAVALGRKGGLKGGPARAEKLSPAKRKKIAKKAAEARWKFVAN